MRLLEAYTLQKTQLENRMVMAPMTRSRATGNLPNAMMVSYYGERAGAGLIITEGTSISPNALGYPRIPGIFSGKQLVEWKKVTQVVHDRGGKIFMQLFHTGRVSHPENMPDGAKVLAPSAVVLEGEMYTDTKGPLAHPEPKAMSPQEIQEAREEFVTAARNAIKAGFDGVEIHAANGYLLDQFQNTASNKRKDDYGGSVENRCRFTLDVARAIVEEIGPEKTGIRLSPYSTFNGMEVDGEHEEMMLYLVQKLDKLNLAYLHLVDNRAMDKAEMEDDIFKKIRENFTATLIHNGGLDKEEGETLLKDGHADLVAYGRPFLANPDLVYRFSEELPLNHPDPDTFYTPGEEGYLDYPVWEEEKTEVH